MDISYRKILASSSEDAFSKANTALPTLSGSPKAEYMNGFMDCSYSIGYGYVTDAFTKYIG